MTVEQSALDLLKALNLPEEAASVLAWYEGEAPTLRIWVAERYQWHVRKIAPQEFAGYHVDIEVRPTLTAQRGSSYSPSVALLSHLPNAMHTDPLLASIISYATRDFGTDPEGWDKLMSPAEIDEFMKFNNSDRSIETVYLGPDNERN